MGVLSTYGSSQHIVKVSGLELYIWEFSAHELWSQELMRSRRE